MAAGNTEVLPAVHEVIPLHKAFLGEEEQHAASEVIASNNQAGDGAVSRRCEVFFSKLLEIPYVYLTGSCTHALELALMTLDIGPGDEVICPSFTFTSTATAIVQHGCYTCFC